MVMLAHIIPGCKQLQEIVHKPVQLSLLTQKLIWSVTQIDNNQILATHGFVELGKTALYNGRLLQQQDN